MPRQQTAGALASHYLRSFRLRWRRLMPVPRVVVEKRAAVTFCQRVVPHHQTRSARRLAVCLVRSTLKTDMDIGSTGRSIRREKMGMYCHPNDNKATFIKELSLPFPEGEEVRFPRRRLHPTKPLLTLLLTKDFDPKEYRTKLGQIQSVAICFESGRADFACLLYGFIP